MFAIDNKIIDVVVPKRQYDLFTQTMNDYRAKWVSRNGRKIEVK